MSWLWSRSLQQLLAVTKGFKLPAVTYGTHAVYVYPTCMSAMHARIVPAQSWNIIRELDIEKKGTRAFTSWPVEVAAPSCLLSSFVTRYWRLTKHKELEGSSPHRPWSKRSSVKLLCLISCVRTAPVCFKWLNCRAAAASLLRAALYCTSLSSVH